MSEPTSAPRVTASGLFPIVSITDAMILQEEPMGSKDKFWCQLPEEAGSGRWLFKQPRNDREKMEHLAEKFAQEFAAIIGVPCARIELAEYNAIRGTISLDVQKAGQVLVHGNEVIAGRVMGYDPTKKRRTSDHTYERIRQAILEVCEGRCENDLRQFAGYLVLDALIGNTDRHHENWALLRRESREGADYELAPSFDHASSLGREMRDERRVLLLREHRLDSYIRGGAGAVYLAELGEIAISPMELVERLTAKNRNEFTPWLCALEDVTTESVNRIFARVPNEWMSSAQRDFAAALISRTREMLMALVK